MRFRIINADASFQVRLSMYYSVPNRIDLYLNGSYIPPTNAFYDSNGNMVLQDPTGNLQALKPNYSNESGTNLVVKSDNKIYFSIDGSGSYIDLVIAPVLYLKFGFPAISDAQFFDPANLVKNMAALLNIDASKIRSVQIVSANSVGRKRRDTASGDIIVQVFVYTNAVPLLNQTTQFDNNTLDMMKIQAAVANRYITGQLQTDAQNMFNVTMSSMFIQPVYSNKTESQLNTLYNVKIVTQADECREQSPCGIQPVLLLVDKDVIIFCCTKQERTLPEFRRICLNSAEQI
jgi:hypothetical protein